jgi:hypothetical protein
LKTAFFAYGRPDHAFASQLAEFLEFGCNLTCYVEDGLIGEGQDLISMAEEGLSADVLVLLLSKASSPPRWVREPWEPVLFHQARSGVEAPESHRRHLQPAHRPAAAEALVLATGARVG